MWAPSMCESFIHLLKTSGKRFLNLEQLFSSVWECNICNVENINALPWFLKQGSYFPVQCFVISMGGRCYNWKVFRTFYVKTFYMRAFYVSAFYTRTFDMRTFDASPEDICASRGSRTMSSFPVRGFLHLYRRSSLWHINMYYTLLSSMTLITEFNLSALWSVQFSSLQFCTIFCNVQYSFGLCLYYVLYCIF